jgi:hypothetical protein
MCVRVFVCVCVFQSHSNSVWESTFKTQCNLTTQWHGKLTSKCSMTSLKTHSEKNRNLPYLPLDPSKLFQPERSCTLLLINQPINMRSRKHFVRLSLLLMSAVISVICLHCDSHAHTYTMLALMYCWDFSTSYNQMTKSPSCGLMGRILFFIFYFKLQKIQCFYFKRFCYISVPIQSASVITCCPALAATATEAWSQTDKEIDRHRTLLYQAHKCVTIDHKE